ncbi:hypothetical protein DYI25_18230 [Mesobacillus boroniphilus]|uniref:DUF4359 domain-containing protein n=1 Tax=Mesobacillus boroniphilus TaxID=308892 RepID=A0A944GY56_9BACI|nr:hypothetical protein [Mesobacillus boroniphilus]MBS8266364.1 hypothetical protein [Mesobacillus boroniphilus]
MKKRTWLLLFVAVITAAAIAIIQKPDESDFASWMEDTYDIQCLDERCDNFLIEEGNERILMQSVHGGYSSGVFLMEVHNTYRNFDDASYYLELEVAGVFGNIMIKNEKVKRINKR